MSPHPLAEQLGSRWRWLVDPRLGEVVVLGDRGVWFSLTQAFLDGPNDWRIVAETMSQPLLPGKRTLETYHGMTDADGRFHLLRAMVR